MIDYESLKLMHFHGDEGVELVETTGDHHDAASHDPEQRPGWARRIFECPSCQEKVVADAKRATPAAAS